MPDKSDQHASELLAAKTEILRLHAQLKRTEEEREILKKAARYFAREIVLDALMMAVWRLRPAQSVLIHSDQGSQYGSSYWKRFYDANNLEPSMNRRGNCWDNAVAETFFSSLKKERIHKRIYKTRELARSDVFGYIEGFYNRSRRHSHLDGISPEAFERASV